MKTIENAINMSRKSQNFLSSSFAIGESGNSSRKSDTIGLVKTGSVSLI